MQALLALQLLVGQFSPSKHQSVCIEYIFSVVCYLVTGRFPGDAKVTREVLASKVDRTDHRLDHIR